MKFATSVRLAVAVKVYELLELTTFPFSVQLLKEYPVFAEAVTVTDDPDVLVPPPLVAPPAVGLELSVMVYVVFAVKFAPRVRLAVAVKVYELLELTAFPFSVQLLKE